MLLQPEAAFKVLHPDQGHNFIQFFKMDEPIHKVRVRGEINICRKDPERVQEESCRIIIIDQPEPLPVVRIIEFVTDFLCRSAVRRSS
jgi:hypothetical protein